jgi:hypothetical protein
MRLMVQGSILTFASMRAHAPRDGTATRDDAL